MACCRSQGYPFQTALMLHDTDPTPHSSRNLWYRVGLGLYPSKLHRCSMMLTPPPTFLLLQVALCEQVFPLVIHDILLASNGQFRAVLSRQVKHFFHAVGSMPRPSSPLLLHPRSSRGCNIHPDSIRTMLNMVMYLRTLDKPKQS